MVTEIKIKQCYQCPFRGSTMDGAICGHPYWKDKGAYDNIIITHEGIPESCPLKKENLNVVYSLAINNE